MSYVHNLQYTPLKPGDIVPPLSTPFVPVVRKELSEGLHPWTDSEIRDLEDDFQYVYESCFGEFEIDRGLYETQLYYGRHDEVDCDVMMQYDFDNIGSL